MLTKTRPFFSSSDFSTLPDSDETYKFFPRPEVPNRTQQPHTPTSTSISLEAHPVETCDPGLIDTPVLRSAYVQPPPPHPRATFISPSRRHHFGHYRFGSLLPRGSSSLLPRFTRPDNSPANLCVFPPPNSEPFSLYHNARDTHLGTTEKMALKRINKELTDLGR